MTASLFEKRPSVRRGLDQNSLALFVYRPTRRGISVPRRWVLSEEATATTVPGFPNVNIEGLPPVKALQPTAGHHDRREETQLEPGYIYAMAGSPRKKGNTETLLDAAVNGAEEAGIRVVRADIGRTPFNPCLACDGCFQAGECVQKDEMQEIYPHLLGAAGIILAAPIFSMNINAQSKAMIDRCQRFWSTKYVLKRDVVAPEFRARRLGLFLSVCGRDDPRIFDCTVPTLAYFFHVLEVPVWDRLTYHNVDARGAISEHPTALDDARAAGRHMAEALMGADDTP